MIPYLLLFLFPRVAIFVFAKLNGVLQALCVVGILVCTLCEIGQWRLNRTQNLCPESKNVFDLRQKHLFFCFRTAKSVSATHVSRAANLGNIYLGNNFSATAFPSLARFLESAAEISTLQPREPPTVQ